jgi:hypothetical protein
MKCRDCIHFYAARNRFTLSYKHIAFLCPTTGKIMSEHSETFCEYFCQAQSDDCLISDNPWNNA